MRFLPCKRVWLYAALFAGLGVRLYSAAYFSTSMNPDMGTYALMTKHIAEGVTLPVFFYGQAYLGSLTAYISALPYRILGHSMFAVLLGPAFVSVVSLMFFWLWSKSLFDEKTGLFGLGVMAIGSYSFLYYAIFSGYPIALATGLAGCWCTTKLIGVSRDAHLRKMVGWCLGLGFSAGLGWWSNQLSLAYFAACGAVLLIGLPIRKIVPVGLMCVPGVFVGAAPWILYTLHNADSLDVLNQTSTVREGWGRMLWVYGQLFFGLFDGAKASGIPGILAAATLMALVVSGLAGVMKKKFLRSEIPLHIQWIFPMAVLVANAALCMASGRFWHVPAVRYLYPSAPIVFLLSGAGLALLSTHQRRWLAPGVLGLILFLQFQNVPSVWNTEWKESVRQDWRDIEKLEAFALENQIEVFRGDWMLYGLNFATEENVKISAYPVYDRYRPYREIAARSDHVGVLNNYKQFAEFIRRQQADVDQTVVGRYRIIHDIHLPFPEYRWISPAEFTLSHPVLVDNHLDTPLEMGDPSALNPESGSPVQVDIVFTAPQSVSRIVVHGPTGKRIHVVSVSAVQAAGEHSVVYERKAYDPWFSSMDGFYPEGYLEHEAVITGISEPLTSLQIEIPTTRDGRLRATEIVLYQSVSDTSPDTEYARLHTELNSLGVPKVYASRRVSEKLHPYKRTYRTIIPESYYHPYDGYDLYENLLQEVNVMDAFACVTDNADVMRNREVLNSVGLTWTTKPVGGRTVFVVDPPEEPPGYSLIWTEQGLFKKDPTLAIMRKAHHEYTKGREAEDHQNSEEAISKYTQALDLRPDHEQAGIRLQELAVKGHSAESASTIRTSKIRFGNRFTFEGLTLGATSVQKGQHLNVTYAWRSEPGIDPAEYAVFIHIEGPDGARFQDDHILLENISRTLLKQQPFPALFEVPRTWNIPVDIPTGEYTIYIGVYHRITGRRLKATTELISDDDRVQLVESLFVVD